MNDEDVSLEIERIGIAKIIQLLSRGAEIIV